MPSGTGQRNRSRNLICEVQRKRGVVVAAERANLRLVAELLKKSRHNWAVWAPVHVLVSVIAPRKQPCLSQYSGGRREEESDGTVDISAGYLLLVVLRQARYDLFC